MKYIKYILLTFVLIVVTVLSTSIIYHYSVSKNNKTDPIPNNNMQDVIDKDSNKDNSNSITNEEQKNNDFIQEEQTPNIDEIPKVENNTFNNEKIKEENKTTNPSNSGTTTTTPNYQPPKVEEQPSREQTAWEELGISEYDYYHKPLWSWARIDFSIDDYGTEENTKNACISKGNKLMEESQEGLGFSCQSILSYAGNYLGEMIKTF
mgnify:FL=1